MDIISNNKNNGQFVKGASGNPAGRPPGSRNRASLLMESLLEGEAEELTRKAIELAKKGDTRALGFCMDRLMPPHKDSLVHFDLPAMRNSDDIPQGMTSIMAAIGDGAITPTEGERLCRILTELANAFNSQDLLRRVEKLEEGRHRRDKLTVVKSYR